MKLNLKHLLPIFGLLAVVLVFSPSAVAVSCAQGWSATTAYNGGAVVSFAEINYTAAFWTQNQEPDKNNGPAGSGQPWISNGVCEFAPPPPTATPTIKSTPKPTASPTATPTPITICGEPAWSATTSYPQGALVGYNGSAWSAVIANKGVTPGTNSSIWTPLGRPCIVATATPTPTVTVTPTPTPSPYIRPTATATVTPTANPNGHYPYVVKDVGSYAGVTLGYAVNDSGEVGGISNTTIQPPSSNGGGTPTPTPFPRTFVLLGGAFVDPCNSAFPITVENVNGINASGVAVGQCGYNRPFSFHDSTLTILPVPVAGGVGDATAINSAGMIVGAAEVSVSGQVTHAVLWNNGVVTDLGTLGGNWSYATAINTGGTIVGAAYAADNGLTHAFLYSNGSMTDLGADSYAYGINDSGQVVGWANAPTLASAHAFLYSGGTLTDLGALIASGSSTAYAINNSGVIVGKSSSNDSSGNTHPFVYSNGTMIDLNTLIDPDLQLTLTEARAISPNGNIVANGSDGRAFLLTPAPAIPAWAAGVAYSAGQQVTYNGHTYKCLQAHTSQVGWEPPNVPALWQLIL